MRDRYQVRSLWYGHDQEYVEYFETRDSAEKRIEVLDRELLKWLSIGRQPIHSDIVAYALDVLARPKPSIMIFTTELLSGSEFGDLESY